MIRLLYISTARTELSESELAALLETSRRNNASVGITGLLVVGGRRFLQILEGEREDVMATFARIRSDKRHFATVVLSDADVCDRLFGGWQMRYERLLFGAGQLSLESQVADVLVGVHDETLRAYFQGFAAQHGDKAAA